MALKVVAQSIVQKAVNSKHPLYQNYYIYGNDKSGWFIASSEWLTEIINTLRNSFNPLLIEYYSKDERKWIPVEKT